VRQWGFRAKIDPVLVLNAKGGENKAKANGSTTPCEIFRVGLLIGLLICQNTLTIKIWSLVGRMVDYGKRGSFWLLIIFTLGLSLFESKHVCLT
jgi:hypothetical protein